MSKQDISPLVEAAAAFDEGVATYNRVGELLPKTRLSRVKHLERANGALAELAGDEQKLQEAAPALVKALGAARDQHEALAKEVVTHVPAVQQRNTRFQELITELAAVAGEVGGLNVIIQGKAGNGDATAEPLRAIGKRLQKVG